MTIVRRSPEAPHCPPLDRDRELIHVDCASHTYPDGSIGIHDMCFYVLKNEIVAICGPNGSGKSTLIEHLNGLLLPAQGSIWVNGRVISGGAQAGLWKEVGVVFQRSEDQLFAPTVLDDVMFGPLNLGLAPDEARARAMESLKAVGAADLVDKIPNYLSGGQKRLVSIAGILAMKPIVIAMDEPTSDLDPVHVAIIEEIILDLKEKHGISVVIATHDMDLAARIADRICLVRDGAVFAEGLPEEVFYDPALIAEAGLNLPAPVQAYLDLCHAAGIAPAARPLKTGDLVAVLGKIMSGRQAGS
ncbi:MULTISPECIES: energy-coupling factor ABC transporter ATP-binding protein [unclassified Methanoregula]|uniref:energy-coupling factor ABC transporter ATP-binding protein n=1 Tax=unclassified Methanoregula TaxID=2649730 RepID=UPI0009C9739C|nr:MULTISPECIES: ATP-binding cassette domain-containing protein [unclassified Methanoregula]OPX64407.1 MAG: Trehalose/maltose import ATP-binding protein MalK [Methanoregula sp. PtaB.Bin085]OPY34923.1 MAG: Trehalose/maltose import ATP-binding protein MalK [Methanoregula sp. PtaU1.Bin006]